MDTLISDNESIPRIFMLTCEKALKGLLVVKYSCIEILHNLFMEHEKDYV
jgi:hypothetical protein